MNIGNITSDNFNLDGNGKDIQIEVYEQLIKQLQQENKQLKEQLEYLRSGEYYNQLRFENEMLQQVVDTNGVPSEVYDYIDCTHRNTELLKENQELKSQLKGTTHCFDEEEHERLKFEKEQLNSLVNSCQEEIRQLKKQLTTYQILHRDCNIDNLKNISKIEEMKNQQKEFIEWLKAMNRMYQNEYKDIDTAEHYNCVLKKYKIIIGVIK